MSILVQNEYFSNFWWLYLLFSQPSCIVQCCSSEVVELRVPLTPPEHPGVPSSFCSANPTRGPATSGGSTARRSKALQESGKNNKNALGEAVFFFFFFLLFAFYSACLPSDGK